jgi:hypothetical protein
MQFRVLAIPLFHIPTGCTILTLKCINFPTKGKLKRGDLQKIYAASHPTRTRSGSDLLLVGFSVALVAHASLMNKKIQFTYPTTPAFYAAHAPSGVLILC